MATPVFSQKLQRNENGEIVTTAFVPTRKPVNHRLRDQYFSQGRFNCGFSLIREKDLKRERKTVDPLRGAQLHNSMFDALMPHLFVD